MAVAAETISGACAICAAARATAGEPRPGPGSRLVVHADDVLIAFVQPDVVGVLIAPRQHTDRLSTTPELAGILLAGIRRAAVGVQAFYGASGVSVQPTTHFPGAPGHVCFGILPTLPARNTAHGVQLGVLVSALRGLLTAESAGQSAARLLS